MPIDTTDPQSPGWWLALLGKRLLDQKRQDRFNDLDGWLRGNPPMPTPASTMQDAVRNVLCLSRTSLAELVVEACRERMRIVGIRTSIENDETGDAAAWRVYRRAGMQVESAEIIRTMLGLSSSYAIVGPPDPDTGVPTITGEDPRQVITYHDPAYQRRVKAALKMYYDPLLGQQRAYVYLPGHVYVAGREAGPGAQMSLNVAATGESSWEWDAEAGGAGGQKLPTDTMMPVVRFRNNQGLGDFETHLDLLRRLNHLSMQLLVIATFQAFRQRLVSGELPETDDRGNKINYDDMFSAHPGALWKMPSGVELKETGQVDLTPILSAIKDDLTKLAAVTRTPMHMLDPGGENQSAEGAELSREGLVFRAEDRIARADDGFCQVMSLAFRWMAETDQSFEKRADLDSLSLIWAPVERYSLSERYTAATQARSAGVPLRTIWTEILQFSPDRADVMESELIAETFNAFLAQIQAGSAQATAPALPTVTDAGGAG